MKLNNTTTILSGVIILALASILALLLFQNNNTNKDASVNSTTNVIINVGDDIQQIVNNNPAGTTYLIKTGLHRLQSVNPKTGDTFIGEQGTILNGSKLLSNFQQSGGRWYVTGQTQEARKKGECISGFPRCNYAEELFINDVPMHHVDSLSDVEPGTWYFDYSADRIYIGDNPSGKKVEASAKERAFSGSAQNVTIRNLIIEKYSNRAQEGVIHAGEGWLIENNETRFNHGAGIKINTDVIVRNNHVHNNGQIGMVGSGENGLVEYNEISYNNRAGFIAGWEGGNTKFSYTKDLVVRGNYVHHSVDGPGLWTDIENIGTLYEDNIVVFNGGGEGIKHEINHSVEIRNNFSGYNGEGHNWYWGAQILIQNSRDGYIHGNTVVVGEGYASGIAIVNQNRGSTSPNNVGIPAGVTRLSLNNNIENNDIYMLDTNGKYIGVAGDYELDQFYTGNTASKNKFYGQQGMDTEFVWEWGTPRSGGGYTHHKNYAQYKNGPTFGEDSQMIMSGYTIPEIPVFSQTVGPDFETDQAAPICGNGQLESGEQCDDGNTNNNDGCSNVCLNEIDPSQGGDYSNDSGPTYVAIELENYNEGGQGVGYNDTDSENRGGAYRNEGVDVKEIVGGYAIGWMATGEWLEYDVDVQTEGEYSVVIRYATTEQNASIQLSADGTDFDVIPLPGTGSYENYQLLSVNLGNLNSGINTIRVTSSQQYADIDSIRLNLEDSSDGRLTSTIDPSIPISNEVICGYIDVDFDYQLTLADFARFALVYGRNCGDTAPVEGCGPVDSNRDSLIDLVDFAYFATRYGRNNTCLTSNE